MSAPGDVLLEKLAPLWLSKPGTASKYLVNSLLNHLRNYPVNLQPLICALNRTLTSTCNDPRKRMVKIPGLTSLMNVMNIIGNSVGDPLHLIGPVNSLLNRLVNITKEINAP